MTQGTSEPPWLTHARQYLGQAEIPGWRNNPLILRWWEAIKAPFRDDETPWCAAFVGGVLEEQGFRSSRNAAARSYMTWGVRLDYFATGCIVVLSRPGSSWSGHVGFLVGFDTQGRILLLGGNQGNRVSITPFDASRVIGLRWPMPIDSDALMPIHFRNVRTLAFDSPTSTDEA